MPKTSREELIDLKKLKKDLTNRVRAISSRDLTDENAAKWTSENQPLLMELVAAAPLSKTYFKRSAFQEIEELLGRDDFSFSEEILLKFCCDLTENERLSDEQTRLFPELFLFAVARRIVKAVENKSETIPLEWMRLHQLTEFSFSRIEKAASPLDKILRSDPSGEYALLTDDTRALYKKIIKKEAKKHRVAPEEEARTLIAAAEKKHCHVGFLFPKKKADLWAIPVVLLLTLLCEWGIFATQKSALITVLSLVPAYFFCDEIFTFFYQRLKKAVPCAALRVVSVARENALLVGVPCLIAKKEDVDRLTERLWRFYLNNAERDDCIYFGLLCDFPGSKSETAPGDEDLKTYLTDRISSLNEKAPHFYAFVRKRVYVKTERAYGGRERKRGAVEEWVHFLVSGILPDGAEVLGVEKSALHGAPYFLTLDEDTDLGIGMAKRLLGIALHPFHRPVVKTVNGKARVIKGYGVLQPRVIGSIMRGQISRYSKIYGNGSGSIAYSSATPDKWENVLGNANFCGKGLIHCAAFDRVLYRALPEETILSHDFIEGAILRVKGVSEEYFTDTSPDHIVSDYMRRHRWIRGDVQNLAVIKTLPARARLFLGHNLLYYLRPLFGVLILLTASLYGRSAGGRGALLVSILWSVPVVTTFFDLVLSRNFEHFGRRFDAKMRNLLLNAVYQYLLSLGALLFEAIHYTDAILRAFFRMTISHRHLLQWQTYQTSRKTSNWRFFMPEILVAAGMLFICRSEWVLLFVFFFLFYPVAGLYLSLPYEKKKYISAKTRKYLTELAEKEFSFFMRRVGESTSYLPPDNVQIAPLEKIALRTSPTNIGLYFAAMIAARDFGFLEEREILTRLEKAMDSVEKLEKYKGHLYNWYDLEALSVIGERFISTVDSGNFIAGLEVTVSGLAAFCDPDGRVRRLTERIERVIKETDFSFLFDRTRNLFSVGFFPEEKRSVSLYDQYMSEARITSYLSISRGQIPAEHWKALSRPVFSFYGRAGIGSWTGTAFEYFMAPLFLPVIPDTMEDESLNFALYCQKKAVADPDGASPVFGISESGYSATDADGNYQYRAFGVPYLALHCSPGQSRVIAPYATFLMLERMDNALIRNLENLEKIGAVGMYGYYEAIEFNSRFLDDYRIVYSYMAHHKAMSVLALDNLLFEDSTVRRFLAYGSNEVKTELLGERFPLEAKVSKKKPDPIEPVRIAPPQNREFAVSRHARQANLLSDGKLSLYTDDACTVRLFENDLIFFSESPELIWETEEGRESALLDTGENAKGSFSEIATDYRARLRSESVRLTWSLISGKYASVCRVERNGLKGKGVLCLRLRAAFLSERDFRAHPAFHLLSLEFRKLGNKLYVLRRGEVDREFVIEATRPFSVKLGNIEKHGDFRHEIAPDGKIELRVPFEASGGVTLAFGFYDFSKNPLFDLASVLDGSNAPDRACQKSAAQKAKRLREVCRFTESAEKICRLVLPQLYNRRFLLEDAPVVSGEFLWGFGISGDHPLATLYVDSQTQIERNALPFIALAKRLLISGVQADFVILHPKTDAYFNKLARALSEKVEEADAAFLLRRDPGLHFVALKDKSERQTFQRLSASGFGYPDEGLAERVAPETGTLCPFSEKRKNFDAPSVGRLVNGGFLRYADDYPADAPLSYLCATPHSGFFCDQYSLGFTFWRNATLARLTAWENLPDKNTGEKVFLKLDGALYDLVASAESLFYENGTVRYEGEFRNIRYCIRAFSSMKSTGKNVLVSFFAPLPENAFLVYSFIPALGKHPRGNVSIRKGENTVVFSPVSCAELPCCLGIFADCPAYSVTESDGRIYLNYPARERISICLFGFENKAHYDYTVRVLKKTGFEELAEYQKDEWQSFFPEKTDVETSFLRQEAFLARMVARTGVYQPGGAYGFRDQLQDALSLLDFAPEKTVLHLIRCAAHQFLEGDVMHWWHPIKRRAGVSDPGLRTRCSDDYLWLVFAATETLKKTGDRRFLSTKVPFLESTSLKANEIDRYESARVGKTAPMIEHLTMALELFIDRGLGLHDLPPILAGDWNDGMNRLNGESVWLGFFGAICLHRGKTLSERFQSARFEAFFARLVKGLDSSFNGVWYPRAFLSEGSVLGSDITLESECSIDLITQAFAGLYAVEVHGTPFAPKAADVRSALISAFEVLVSEKKRIVKLFEKPFSSPQNSPGYIRQYADGVRENGGQYTHAAVFFALALALFGEMENDPDLIRKAKTVRDILDPFRNLLSVNFRQYQKEPYVLAGDVFTSPGRVGEGGWSWYTGAAGWYLRLNSELKRLEKKFGLEA